MYSRVLLTEPLDRHCPLVTVQCRHSQLRGLMLNVERLGVVLEHLKDVSDAPAVMTSGGHGPMNSRE